MTPLAVFEGSRDEAVSPKEARVLLGLDAGCPEMIPSLHLALASIPLIPQLAEISDHRSSSPETAFQDHRPQKGLSGVSVLRDFRAAFAAPADDGSACWWAVGESWADHWASRTPQNGPWLLRSLSPPGHLHTAPDRAFQHPSDEA